MRQSNKNLQPAASADNFSIDRAQATTQLEALEFKRGDAIYVRAFLPKEDPRSAPNTGRKADKLNWKQIEHWQAQGYGIYIVVNGGGHKDADVKRCRAIFIEHDDLEIELQQELWKTLNLPEPTLQVQTRKSVHSYWVIEGGCDVGEWKPLQADLLAYTNADPAIKNPSRVMRLAGAYHIKPGCEAQRCDIIHNSGKKYSYSELRASVPAPVPSTPPPTLPLSSVPPEKNQSVAPLIQRYEDIRIPVTESVPLEYCLARESRSILSSGLSEGSRNAGGAKLARDLIGTANYLQSIGQRFDGNPRQLLEDYSNRCTPPLLTQEVEGIWKSAEKDSPTPSCQAEGVETCIRAWYWKHHVKPQQSTWKSHNHTHNRGFGQSNNNSGNQPQVATVALCDRIKDILNRHESESETVSALMDLATATGRTYRDLDRLARIIRAEGELATEVIEAVQSFQGILKSSRKRLDIRRYLDKTLPDPLMAKAAAMPTAPEYLFNTVLPSSASRIGTAARVVINPEGGYTQSCIFWAANVNHSGQAKTPPQQVVVKPLEDMEAAAKEIYDRASEDYENDKDVQGQPPVRQRRLLNNVTTSTKIRIHDENPRGLLEYIDELVADYQRLNQYKSGKGDDLQLELSFWNGSGGNFDRHDARLFLRRVALSKTGTYQWDTLARLMANDEVNFIASGYSSRFLYCSVLDAPVRYLDLLSPPNPDANKLEEKLNWLYEELEKLPEADYLLSHEAKVLFQGWNHILVNAEMEEKHFGLSLVYAKIESYTARIALWLHIVNAVLRREKPRPAIDGQTMQHAIKIASFYLDQHKLIHAHNAPNRQPEGIFLKVQTQAEKVLKKCGKGVSASFVKSRINALKSWAADKIRSSIFKALAAAGHGRIQGEGSEMVYIPNTTPTEADDLLVGVGEELVESPIAENFALKNLQTSNGEIGGVVPSSTLSQTSDEAITPSHFANASSSNHQFTNSSAQTSTPSDLHSADGPTNSLSTPPVEPKPLVPPPVAQNLVEQILLCSAWVEIARRVNQNGEMLLAAARKMTQQQRQGLTRLLIEHLCQSPAHLGQLAWIPEKLRQQALEALTFTVGRIADVAESVLDATWEVISGCRLKEVSYLGTQYEMWIFTLPDGNSLGTYLDAVEAIACDEE